MESTAVFDQVVDVVQETLGIADRSETVERSTPLLGAVPELDSMAVVEVVLALEQRFEVEIDDADVTGEMFETFGGLAEVVEARLS